MSYEPTQWKAGDTVTSAKLNKIEQGIVNSGDILRVNIHDIDGSLVVDKTWQQIKDAQLAMFVLENESTTAYPVDNTYYYIMSLDCKYSPYYNTSEYTIVLRNELAYITIELTTDDPDGYPSQAIDNSGELPK